MATRHGMGHGRQHRSWRAGLGTVILVALAATRATAAEQIYFAATDNITNVLVQKINAETVRVDMSCWYLSEHAISIALLNKFKSGVAGASDRRSRLDLRDRPLDQERVLLAGQPGRADPPALQPDLDSGNRSHEGDDFAGQNLVAFGSSNYAPTELAPRAEQLRRRDRPGHRRPGAGQGVQDQVRSLSGTTRRRSRTAWFRRRPTSRTGTTRVPTSQSALRLLPEVSRTRRR